VKCRWEALDKVFRPARRLPAAADNCTLARFMTKLTRVLLITALVAASTRSGAQMAGPSPLSDPQTVALTVPGGWIAAEARASAALQAGFPRTAISIYQEILFEPALPADARQRVILGRVTAWLDVGDVAAADKALQTYDGPRNSDYQLRAGLIAIGARRLPAAKAALAASKIDELSPAEKGWWYFLQASVADLDNDLERRNRAYEEAGKVAVTELQRARFALAQEQARMRSGQLNEAQVKMLRDNMERFQGTRFGYEALRAYAAALAGSGRASEAQSILQRQLAILPQSEKNVADQLRLVLGLVSGEGSQAGQQAFRQLLREGQKPETQRLALQLLTRGAKTLADRDLLRRDLTDLITTPVQNPIIEDLLLVRAQTELIDKQYALAYEDARALLERYQTSTLKAAALGVQLSVAWDLKRYRLVADVIVKLREIIPESRERAELGVLLAEAFFRSEDYKNAAYAYDAALREPPAVVSAGTLIFQRVLSDIRADQLDSAIKQLDEVAANPAFDPESRWQAEWNLTKQLQVAGRTKESYDRVNKLLQGGTKGVADELRIRLLWLQAKLSFDNDQPAVTLQQTEQLAALLQTNPKLEARLLGEVKATTQLLRAQALLKLDREDEGIAVLAKMRTDFVGTKAAEYSYLVQADHLTRKGDLTGAREVLISFVDNKTYAGSEYAPLALYEAALNLERQGLDRQLGEANDLLEQLNNKYPHDDLVFYSRLKQGDLFRKLNDFPTARHIYEFLVHDFNQHPDVLLAQLALADTLFAQGGNVNIEGAETIFERLRDLPSAPTDLRVEAGATWGFALMKRSQTGNAGERAQTMAKAQSVLWSVVNNFLLDPGQAPNLHAKGRFWLSRSLLELGQIHEDAGHLDEAQKAYQLIVDSKLGGSAQAKEKLSRYRLQEGSKP